MLDVTLVLGRGSVRISLGVMGDGAAVAGTVGAGAAAIRLEVRAGRVAGETGVRAV